MLSLKAIRTKALHLLDEFSVVEPPVPVRKIIEGHVLTIEEVDREDSYDGELVAHQRKIRLNRRRPLTRQRFTLAHELGHWVLFHADRLHEEESDLDEYGDDAPPPTKLAREIHDEEANKFAAELLMPATWLPEHWKEYGRDAKKLATLYQVSEEAMWYRIEALRLLKR